MKYKVKPTFKNVITKDRFTRGLVSGLFAAVAMSFLNYIFILTTSATNKFADFVGILLFGSKPDNVVETLSSLFAHVFLGGILGVIFAYLLLLISEKNLIVKGIVFGLISFFILFSLGVIFKIKGLEFSPAYTVLTKSIGSAFYGFVLAYSLILLKKVSNKL